MKNSMLPSPPAIDDGNIWTSVHPSDATNAAMSSQTCWCTMALRMMPRLECFRAASNCGFINASRCIGAAASDSATGSTAFNEMKLTSMTTMSGRIGRRLPSNPRMSVSSMETTFGWLQHRFVIGHDQARFDRRLRPGPAFEQTALDQQQVRALAVRGHVAVAARQVQFDARACAEACRPAAMRTQLSNA